jgi:hypothetical protein
LARKISVDVECTVLVASFPRTVSGYRLSRKRAGESGCDRTRLLSDLDFLAVVSQPFAVQIKGRLTRLREVGRRKATDRQNEYDGKQYLALHSLARSYLIYQ